MEHERELQNQSENASWNSRPKVSWMVSFDADGTERVEGVGRRSDVKLIVTSAIRRRKTYNRRLTNYAVIVVVVVVDVVR